jgi:hypothetical protein
MQAGTQVLPLHQHTGFYVFVRALQLLKANNDGVILVSSIEDTGVAQQPALFALPTLSQPSQIRCQKTMPVLNPWVHHAGWVGRALRVRQDCLLTQDPVVHARCVRQLKHTGAGTRLQPVVQELHAQGGPYPAATAGVAVISMDMYNDGSKVRHCPARSHQQALVRARRLLFSSRMQVIDQNFDDPRLTGAHSPTATRHNMPTTWPACAAALQLDTMMQQPTKTLRDHSPAVLAPCRLRGTSEQLVRPQSWPAHQGTSVPADKPAAS